MDGETFPYEIEYQKDKIVVTAPGVATIRLPRDNVRTVRFSHAIPSIAYVGSTSSPEDALVRVLWDSFLVYLRLQSFMRFLLFYLPVFLILFGSGCILYAQAFLFLKKKERPDTIWENVSKAKIRSVCGVALIVFSAVPPLLYLLL